MSGFGNDLKQEQKITALFRKVSGGNIFRSEEAEYCFSTAASSKLIAAGDFAIVLCSKEYSGLYDCKDADAGKDFGYDEFRVIMSKAELLENIDVIVVPDSWNDDIDESLFETDKDPMVWIDNLSNYGKVVFESDAQFDVDFNF